MILSFDGLCEMLYEWSGWFGYSFFNFCVFLKPSGLPAGWIGQNSPGFSRDFPGMPADSPSLHPSALGVGRIPCFLLDYSFPASFCPRSSFCWPWGSPQHQLCFQIFPSPRGASAPLPSLILALNFWFWHRTLPSSQPLCTGNVPQSGTGIPFFPKALWWKFEDTRSGDQSIIPVCTLKPGLKVKLGAGFIYLQ